jgi:hypothetical protein
VIIDGDAARAARREATGDEIVYRLERHDFVFPPEWPLAATDVVQQALDEAWPTDRYVREVIAHLLGADAWKRLLDLKPYVADLEHIYDTVWAAYGLSSGESSSSRDSSATGGESSKPKSSASTASTRGGSSRAKRAARGGS